MNSKDKEIKLGILLSYAAVFINIIAALLYTPWMISKIGQNNYGLYILATSLITLFSVDFGLSSATTRFISKYLAEKNQDSINKIIGQIYKLYIFISIVLFIVLFVMYFFISDLYTGLNESEISTFKIIFIILSFYTVISFPFITLDGILSAYEEFIKLKCCDIFNKLFTIFLIVISLLSNHGVIELVLINAFVGIITISIKLYIIKRTLPIKVDFKYRDMHSLKNIFSFSFWVTISQLFQRLIFNVTPSILGIVSNSISMSIFGTAMSLEGYSYTLSNAIGSIFLPKVSRLNHDGSKEEMNKLSISVGKMQFYIISLIFIGFLLVGKDFILLWLGKDFLQVYICALLLIFPCIFHTPQKILQMMIIAKNHVRAESKAYIVMGTINIILSFIFSSKWGAIGACISICISYLIRTIILNVIYYKVLNFDLMNFYYNVYFKNIPLLLCVILIGIVVNTLINIISWKFFFIKGLIIVISYGLLLILLDKDNLKNFIMLRNSSSRQKK